MYIYEKVDCKRMGKNTPEMLGQPKEGCNHQHRENKIKEVKFLMIEFHFP